MVYITFWDSSETYKLFFSPSNETIIRFVIRRINFLNDAALNDDSLLIILKEINNIKKIKSKQRENLCMHCLYSKMAYLVLLQYMNKFTWK